MLYFPDPTPKRLHWQRNLTDDRPSSPATTLPDDASTTPPKDFRRASAADLLRAAQETTPAVPLEQIRPGGPPPDDIPPIDHPR